MPSVEISLTIKELCDFWGVVPEDYYISEEELTDVVTIYEDEEYPGFFHVAGLPDYFAPTTAEDHARLAAYVAQGCREDT